MGLFLLRRLALAVFVVLVVTLLVAWAVRLSGDPAVMLAQGAGSITEQDLVNIRAALGLNRPFAEQYAGFVLGMLSGDMGKSFMGGVPVARMVAQALPLTMLLALLSLGFSLLISIPLGVHAAVQRGGWADQTIR